MSLCEAEKTFVLHGVEEDFRTDGRGREDYRPMELETDIVSHAFGSARLRLANTDVLVAVKLEVDTPFPEKPYEGKIEFFVDCSANATPDFEGRGGEDLAIEISNTLSSAYRSSKAFDLRKLCILKGRKCWKIYVDILLLECGGNLFDAVSLAVKAALWNTQVPLVRQIDIDGNNVELKVSEELYDCQKLHVKNAPVMDPRGKLASMIRTCVDTPTYLNEVIEDETHRAYYRSCRQDLCNGGSGRSDSTSSDNGSLGDKSTIYCPGIGGGAAALIATSFNTILFFYIFTQYLR